MTDRSKARVAPKETEIYGKGRRRHERERENRKHKDSPSCLKNPIELNINLRPLCFPSSSFLIFCDANAEPHSSHGTSLTMYIHTTKNSSPSTITAYYLLTTPPNPNPDITRSLLIPHPLIPNKLIRQPKHNLPLSRSKHIIPMIVRNHTSRTLTRQRRNRRQNLSILKALFRLGSSNIPDE